jgi:prolipoprotein diacylglyceryl transferase
MPVAFIPSPVGAVWHLGPIPVRAFALCMVAGVLAGLWLTDRRYRKAGGQPGVILNVATVAVPVGLLGARIYSVITNFGLYFGGSRDWVDTLRIWDGGLGMAGAVAAGGLAAWLYCRRAGIDIGPLALAAAPALPVAQAIGVLGNWFSQDLYGRPSGLPWAVAIAPAHRAAGYQVIATFQPIWLYESLLYLLVALGVAYGIRRYSLSGDLAFALYAGLYATGRFFVDAQRVDYTPRLFGLRTTEVAMLAIMLAAWPYLVAVRRRRRKRSGEPPRRPAGPQPLQPQPPRPLRARSGTAAAGELGQAPAGPVPAGPMPAGPVPAAPQVPAAPHPAGPGAPGAGPAATPGGSAAVTPTGPVPGAQLQY